METQSEAEAPAPRRGRGRPCKEDPRDAELRELKAERAYLKAELAEKQQATLAPVPPPSEELKPGTLINVGRDSSGSPIMRKVPHTRSYLGA